MNTRKMVFTALFAALIVCGSFISIPIGPIPIVLSTLFVILSGLMLGPWPGALAVILYLLLGILGLPVFAGGTGGFAVLYGPTGGYLIGYIAGSIVAGAISQFSKKIYWLIIGAFAGTAMIYVPGILWLKLSLDLDWISSLNIGIIPFIPGDILKSIAAAIISFYLGDRLFKNEENRY